MGIKINGVQIAGIGAPGKSAYDYAKEGGYPGTENEFKQLMAGPIPITHGGTDANDANQARKNLGAAAVLEMTQSEYDALPAIDPTTFYALTDVEASGVKIETGSYVGTGTYGKSNPNNLTFGFAPKILIVTTKKTLYISNNTIEPILVEFLTTEYESQAVGAYNASGTVYMKKSSDGKIVSWYATDKGYASSIEGLQNNASNTTYRYIAIG